MKWMKKNEKNRNININNMKMIDNENNNNGIIEERNEIMKMINEK